MYPIKLILNRAMISISDFDPCRRRVLGIRLPNEPKGLSEEEHNNFIHSLVDMSAETMIQALGALLIYLDRTWAEVNLVAGVRTPPVLDISLITLYVHPIFAVLSFCSVIFNDESLSGLLSGHLLSLFVIHIKLQSIDGLIDTNIKNLAMPWRFQIYSVFM